MKLKPTYNENEKPRLYYEDENGKEYFYYRDKKRGLIIRDCTEDDVIPWINSMHTQQKLEPKKKKELIKEITERIKKRDDENPFVDLIVTNLSGKILGGVEVYKVTGDLYNTQAELVMRLRDNYMIEQKGEDLIESIFSLHKQYGWFEEKLFLRDEAGNKIELRLEE